VIAPADQILRDLIQSRLPALAGSLSQVGFEPPTDDWKQAVVAAGEERLNLYLHDVRENRKLRTNETHRTAQGGWTHEEPVPERLDCRYLITAWSPATAMPPMVEPTRDEHQLLADAAEVLLRYRELDIDEVYEPGWAFPSNNTASSFPLLAGHAMPVEVAVPDGGPGLAEFWSTMKTPARPALHVTVTVPVFLLRSERDFPMVTTVVTDVHAIGAGTDPAPLHALGGQVARALPGGDLASVPGAWVQLLGISPPALQVVSRRAVTRGDGRFVFQRLRAGRYQLRAVAAGFGDVPREVDLPSEMGEYDLVFP
jgi:hypothetical protein